jgi:hypothetical protein
MCIKWHEFTTKKYTINSILSENIKLAEIEPKRRLFFFIVLGLWCLMPLSTIFQLYRSVLLVEKTRVRRENILPVASH